MRPLYFILVMLTTWMSSSCKTYQVSTKPIQVYAPATQPDPVAPDGFVFIRSGIDSGYYEQRLPPLKVKNAYNTDSYNKKSHNTDTKQKDVGNSKAKGEAIIGNDNAPVEARKHAVIGDGNTVEEERSPLGWGWLVAVLAAAALLIVWRLRTG